jgi:hypothetical protein
VVPAGEFVCGGFDGSDTSDWSAIRLETMDGYQFTPTYGPDRRPCIVESRMSGAARSRGSEVARGLG